MGFARRKPAQLVTRRFSHARRDGRAAAALAAAGQTDLRTDGQKPDRCLTLSAVDAVSVINETCAEGPLFLLELDVGGVDGTSHPEHDASRHWSSHRVDLSIFYNDHQQQMITSKMCEFRQSYYRKHINIMH